MDAYDVSCVQSALVGFGGAASGGAVQRETRTGELILYEYEQNKYGLLPRALAKSHFTEVHTRFPSAEITPSTGQPNQEAIDLAIARTEAVHICFIIIIIRHHHHRQKCNFSKQIVSRKRSGMYL